MTEQQPEPQCHCLGAAAALHYALNDRRPPACPQHSTDPGVDLMPIALNNNAALAAQIGAHLTKEHN